MASGMILFDGISRVHSLSRADYLAHTFESRFYRFRKEYEEQSPVTIENPVAYQEAIEARRLQISNKNNKTRRHTRWEIRKTTVSFCLLIVSRVLPLYS